MSEPETIKAMIKEEEVEGYILKDIPTPVPEGDEVLINVDAVAICGSDIALYKWTPMAKVIATVPFIPGHECTGTVFKTGPEATLKEGQKVAIENHFFCGSCYQCNHNLKEICQNMGQYGHGRKTMHGGCSEYSIVSSKYCYPLTRNITPEQAVLLEPMGVAHNAVERLEVENEDVLVIGCGAVGLLGTSIAKALGARRVIAADIDDSRLGLAKQMGADVLVNTLQKDLKEEIMKETNGDGIGRICEMSGSDVMVNSQFSMLRKGGHVVLVGLPKKPLHVENVLQDVVFKALTLKTVHGRRIFHTWEKCEALIADKEVDVLPVISHKLPMTQFQQAFDELFGGKACKIIMYPSS